MSPLWTGIAVGFVCTVFSVLITFFVTSVSKDNIMKNKIIQGIDIHKQIDHQKSPTDLINMHEVKCDAKKDMPEVKVSLIRIKTALAFLVREANGNPEDYDLI